MTEPSEPVTTVTDTSTPGSTPTVHDGPKSARSFRQRWLTQKPLRVKLVAAMLTLVTFALLVVGAASVVALQDYLTNRVDGQLQTAMTGVIQTGRVPGESTGKNGWPPSDPGRRASCPGKGKDWPALRPRRRSPPCQLEDLVQALDALEVEVAQLARLEPRLVLQLVIKNFRDQNPVHGF